MFCLLLICLFFSHLFFFFQHAFRQRVISWNSFFSLFLFFIIYGETIDRVRWSVCLLLIVCGRYAFFWKLIVALRGRHEHINHLLWTVFSFYTHRVCLLCRLGLVLEKFRIDYRLVVLKDHVAMERNGVPACFVCVGRRFFDYKFEHLVDFFARKTKDNGVFVRTLSFEWMCVTYYLSIDRSELNSTSFTLSWTARNC